MTSRFASFTEQDIKKIVEDKDLQNTKRSMKVAKELFADYVKEKKLREPEEKKELAQTLKTFNVKARKKKICSMYNKTIIRFGFCDIQKNQVLSNGTPTSNLDYSGYHKNLIQGLFIISCGDKFALYVKHSDCATQG